MSATATRPGQGRPPGPPGTLIGGNIREFAPRRLDFLLNLARKFGPIARFRLYHRHVFLVSTPDLIEQVLVTDAKDYIKHFGTRAYKPLLGNGLVTSEGEFWRRQRRVIKPNFTRADVLSYIPVMTKLTDDMLSHWQHGKSFDVCFEFSALTSAIALKALFNLDEPVDRKKFSDNLRLAIDLMTARLRRPLHLPARFPTRHNLKLRSALEELDHVVLNFIAAGRARSKGGSDLLARLLWAQYEDGSRMSDRQLRDEVMTLFLSAHETTALAISWTWYLLSQHPLVEQKLVAEWANVLQGRHATAEDLPRLPYLDAVLLESMRLYPPVFGIGREATRKLNLGGYPVKRGDTVLLSQWVSHRDPTYFDHPEQFRPERWENGLAKRLPQFAYFPFGGGQRKCIGKVFARAEAKIVLSAVGQRYKFTLDPGVVVDVDPQITLHPKYGILTTLQRRETPVGRDTPHAAS